MSAQKLWGLLYVLIAVAGIVELVAIPGTQFFSAVTCGICLALGLTYLSARRE